jgi:hypothetical protein
MPYTASTNAITATTSVWTQGSALTLSPVSSNGGFLTTIVAPETGLATSVIAIDSTAQYLAYGQAGTVVAWNPAAGAGRCISVTNTSNANTEQYIVNGRDMYGIKMSETILASTTSSGTGVGKKAFKYITSIIASTAATISSTGVQVGFVDKFGFPLRTSYFGLTIAIVSSAPMVPTLAVLSSANATLASTVATATSTTPDARGTFNPTLATAGTSASIAAGTAVRITIMQNITAGMAAGVSASDSSAMFGITQFSAI